MDFELFCIIFMSDFKTRELSLYLSLLYFSQMDHTIWLGYSFNLSTSFNKTEYKY